MFDAGRSTNDGKIKVLGYVGGAGAIGVGCLDHPNFQFFAEAGVAGEVAYEGSCECCNAVAVEKMEGVIGIDKIIHDSICIAVEGTVSCHWRRM